MAAARKHSSLLKGLLERWCDPMVTSQDHCTATVLQCKSALLLQQWIGPGDIRLREAARLIAFGDDVQLAVCSANWQTGTAAGSPEDLQTHQFT